MEVVGFVRGDRAKKYPLFAYRKAVPQPTICTKEAPDTISESSVLIVKYRVEIGLEESPDNMSTVKLWLEPNEYTLAQERMLVCVFRASNAFYLHDEYVDIALDMAFGGGNG